MTSNFYAALAATIDSSSERIFLETDDGRSYTRADLARESARFARTMIDAGAVRGDRIAVQIDKSPASTIAMRAGIDVRKFCPRDFLGLLLE